MTIFIRCSRCGAQIELPDDYAWDTKNCGNCRMTLAVPREDIPVPTDSRQMSLKW